MGAALFYKNEVEMMFDAARKNEKVTDLIIGQIRDAVLSGQLKPGDRLASEKELVSQFDVSKATLREALRALEVMGLVESRKGASGGVFITQVELQTTIHSMMNFLHFQSLSISEITMIRFMLEPNIARLVVAKISEEDLETLQSFINSEESDIRNNKKKDIGFHRYLARITNNSMLILIVDFIESHLDEIKQSLDLSAGFYANVRDAHRRILECLAAKDPGGVSAAMAQDDGSADEDTTVEVPAEPATNESVTEPTEEPANDELEPIAGDRGGRRGGPAGLVDGEGRGGRRGAPRAPKRATRRRAEC